MRQRLLLTTFVAIATSVQAAPPAPEVIVINTEGEPIPVTAPAPLPISGNIGVTGTSDVNITNSTVPVSGNVNVKQDGTWSVQVDNATTDPVPISDADKASRTPIAIDGHNLPYVVPADKRFVVEAYTAYYASSDPDSFLVAWIEATTNGSTVPHYLQLTKEVYLSGDLRSNWYTGNQRVKIYADPGSEVTFKKSFAGAVALKGASLTGFLEDYISE